MHAFSLLNVSKEEIPPKTKLGLFTTEQYLVLKCRAMGFTQLETANSLSISRSNASMIESRARRKLESAKETLNAYELLLSNHSVFVEKGTRLKNVPSLVLNEGDRYGIHLKSNLIDIIRLVQNFEPKVTVEGVTTRDLKFDINPRGKVTLEISRKSKSA